MKDIINNMQKGLSEYSPGANTAVESANKALMAIGVYSDKPFSTIYSIPFSKGFNTNGHYIICCLDYFL